MIVSKDVTHGRVKKVTFEIIVHVLCIFCSTTGMDSCIFSLYEHCYAMLGTIVKVEEVSCISHTVGLVGCCVTNGVFSTCFSGYVKHTNNIL